jgi:uncharacterized protein YdhG (YjbR/CyaY superfamily)
MKARVTSVDDYIDVAPENARRRLLEMRAAVKKGAPKAEEGIKWNMPAYSARRILVMFAAFKKHVGFFPTAAVLKEMSKDVKAYETTRGGVKFPLEKPIPAALVTKLTKLRVRHEAEKDEKWRTPTKRSKVRGVEFE